MIEHNGISYRTDPSGRWSPIKMETEPLWVSIGGGCLIAVLIVVVFAFVGSFA